MLSKSGQALTKKYYMNNNAVIGGVIGVVVLIIGFLIISTMNEDPIGVPVTNPSATSSTVTQTQQEREAAFQAERQAKEEQEVAFTIDVSKLPEAQQVALAAVGISSTSSLSITNKMVSCAGVDMSATRMAEIKSGASVTVGEGLKLVSCYNVN